MKTTVKKSDVTYVLELNEKELAFIMACTGAFIDRTSDDFDMYANLDSLAESAGFVGALDDKYFKVEAKENPVIKDAGVDRARQPW